jgi:hypothetical protein
MIKTQGCPYCGTIWVYESNPLGTKGGWEGFLMKNMYNHWRLCEKRTPQERLDWIALSEKRLERKPNDHTKLIFHREFIKTDEVKS